jgi:hypothetical protein
VAGSADSQRPHFVWHHQISLGQPGHIWTSSESELSDHPALLPSPCSAARLTHLFGTSGAVSESFNHPWLNGRLRRTGANHSGLADVHGAKDEEYSPQTSAAAIRLLKCRSGKGDQQELLFTHYSTSLPIGVARLRLLGNAHLCIYLSCTCCALTNTFLSELSDLRPDPVWRSV